MAFSVADLQSKELASSQLSSFAEVNRLINVDAPYDAMSFEITHVQYQRPRPYQPPPPSSRMRSTMMSSVVVSIWVYLRLLRIAQP